MVKQFSLYSIFKRISTKGKNLKRLLKIILILLAVLIVSIVLFKIINVQNIVLKKIYPRKYSEYVEKYAEEYNIDPLLIYSLIKAESNFNPKVKSGSNAIGLMQVMEETAKETAKKSNIRLDDIVLLYEAEINIKIGVDYLSRLIKKYDGNELLALTAYNAGIGNVDKWIEAGTIKSNGEDIENIPFKETSMYVRKISRDYEMYKYLYNR